MSEMTMEQLATMYREHSHHYRQHLAISEAEVKRLRAELAARPTRAEVLRREAGEIVAHCPEHGHRDTYWLDCRCLMAEDILDRVDDPEPGAAGPDTPTPLRWGLGDVELGDDDSVALLLSGPDREPYVLELEPERAAALREVLARSAVRGCRCEPQPSPTSEDTVAEYLYCGADLDRDEFPFTCYRRIGHDGACGPTTDPDASEREVSRG